MTRLMVSGLMIGTALFATVVPATAAKKKTERTSTTSTTSTAPAAKPVPSIPKDAVKNPDGTYSYTDQQGQKWLYVNTPFGVMKNAVKDADSQAPHVAVATKVVDKGETVRFEQSGPFGPISWEKKKTELTDQERQVFDAQSQADAK
jgi:hypothetical protein